MSHRRLGWMAIMIALVAATASAQDDPRIGIAMGYPASIGIVWQVSERVAVRPEISLTRVSGENTTTSLIPVISVGGGLNSSTTTTVTSNETWQVGAGLSGLFYVSRHEHLRTYVSPRWAYTRASTSTSSTGLPSGLNTGAISTGHLVSGSLGAQYSLASRFSVYGEVGIAFSRSVTEPNQSIASFSIGESVSRTIGTRSGAGVVLYF
jgi:opacity protein-like surface antigen